MDEFMQAQADLATRGAKGWWDRAVLSEDQWARLRSAADNPHISHRAIATVLVSWGVDVNVGSVGHWRRNHAG